MGYWSIRMRHGIVCGMYVGSWTKSALPGISITTSKLDTGEIASWPEIFVPVGTLYSLLPLDYPPNIIRGTEWLMFYQSFDAVRCSSVVIDQFCTDQFRGGGVDSHFILRRTAA